MMKRSLSPGNNDGPSQKRLSDKPEFNTNKWKRVYNQVHTTGKVIWSGPVQIPNSQKILFDCSMKACLNVERMKSVFSWKQINMHTLPVAVLHSLNSYKHENFIGRLILCTDENTDTVSYTAFCQAIHLARKMIGIALLGETASSLHLLCVWSILYGHESRIMGYIMTYHTNDNVLEILRSHGLLHCANPEHSKEGPMAKVIKQLENWERGKELLAQENATMKKDIQLKDSTLKERETELARMKMELEEKKKQIVKKDEILKEWQHKYKVLAKEKTKLEEEQRKLHQEQKEMVEKKEGEIQSLQGEMEKQMKLVEEKQKKLTEMEKEVEEMQTRITEKDEALTVKSNALKRESEKLRKKSKALTHQQHEYEVLAKEKTKLEEEQRKLHQEQKEMIEKKEGEIKSLQGEMEKQIKLVEEKQKKLTEMEKEVEEMQTRITEKDEALTVKSNALKRESEKLRTKSEALTHQQHKYKVLEKEKAKLNVELQLQVQMLDEEQKLHQEQKEMVKKKEEDIENLQREMEEKIKLVEEQNTKLTEMKTQIMEKDNALNVKDTEIMTLKDKQLKVDKMLVGVLTMVRHSDAGREGFHDINQSNDTEADTEQILEMESSRLELVHEVTTKQAALDEIGNMMEDEFKCSICSELFIKTVTLNCSHSFCALCIQMWQKGRRNRTCPICRDEITAFVHSVVLDSLIEKIIDKSGDEAKRRRKETVKEREWEMQKEKQRCSIPENVRESDDETSTAASPASSLSHLSPSAAFMSPYTPGPSYSYSPNTYSPSPNPYSPSHN